MDQEIAKRLRYVKVPVLCVANKTDAPSLDSQADEFYRFGRKVIRGQRRADPRQGGAAEGRSWPPAAAEAGEQGRPKSRR